MNLENKKVVIVGFGKTGLAVANFLLNRKVNVFITDKEATKEKIENLKKLNGKIEVEFGKHSSSFLKGTDLIVISPGVDERVLPEIVLEEKIPVVSEIELSYSFSPSQKIIAITGTNGKTTTTLMAGNLLKFAYQPYVVCGNIGNPFISEIEKITKDTYIIIEVSSFQLEKIRNFKPYIGVILNIADDHFDRYANFNEYIRSKENIFINKEENDWAVLNGDDKNCTNTGKKIKGNKIFFGFSKNFDVYFKNNSIYYNNEKIVNFDKTNLIGKGNIYNTMAIVSIGKICNIKNEIIEESLVNFTPPSHRMEKVRQINGITFINDSKATNPHAVENALECLPDGKVILLMGGLDKELPFKQMRNIIEKKVKLLVLFGKAKDKIENELKIKKIPVRKFDNLEDAVDFSYKNSKKGDIVLLSPGCASFDQFKNYEERGNVYKRKVSNLL